MKPAHTSPGPLGRWYTVRPASVALADAGFRRKESQSLGQNNRVFRVTLASRDVDAFLAECEAVGWYGYDMGERIMTEEGPDAEAVLLVEPTIAPLGEAKTPLPQ